MTQAEPINEHFLPKGLLSLIKDAAKKSEIRRIAIVGGAVRDLFLNIPIVSNNNDIDLVVEGSAAKLSSSIIEITGDKRVKDMIIHTPFDTVELKIDDYKIDIASARIEKYLNPAENPKSTPCNLEKDLGRRDFSMNSIAIDLVTMKIIDPFNGLEAIQNKSIELLHPDSVKEDPTRAIRAARYSARLNFSVSESSIGQINETIRSWPWSFENQKSEDGVPASLGTRLKKELDLLLNNEPWEEAINSLQKWGALKLLDDDLQKDKFWKARLYRAKRLNLEPLTALIIGSKNPNYLAKRLNLNEYQQRYIDGSLAIKSFFEGPFDHKKAVRFSPSNWVEIIEGQSWSSTAIAISICKGIQYWEPLLRWYRRWRYIKSPISAKDLIRLGWKEGPEIGNELKRLRNEELNKA